MSVKVVLAAHLETADVTWERLLFAMCNALVSDQVNAVGIGLGTLIAFVLPSPLVYILNMSEKVYVRIIVNHVEFYKNGELTLLDHMLL